MRARRLVPSNRVAITGHEPFPTFGQAVGFRPVALSAPPTNAVKTRSNAFAALAISWQRFTITWESMLPKRSFAISMVGQHPSSTMALPFLNSSVNSVFRRATCIRIRNIRRHRVRSPIQGWTSFATGFAVALFFGKAVLALARWRWPPCSRAIECWRRPRVSAA